MSEPPLTAAEFEKLSPIRRGWVVYMAGCRDDQPNVPHESNPYPPGSEDAEQWDAGQQKAVLDVQDGEE